MIEGRSVIEFGPGSGHNSIVTASHSPARYVLVDGNPTGLESTRNFLKSFSGIEVIESDILEFNLEEKFDIVLAEGLIPLQHDPKNFFARISSFTNEGGILIITTSDPVSFLSETLRRCIAHSISPRTDPLRKRLDILSPIFKSHTDQLPGMTRPLEDWITDSLLIPFTGKLFSMADAIDAVEDLDPYNSSPRFISDWRWYKHMTEDDPGFKKAFHSSYWQNLHNFLDYRISLPPREEATNRELYNHAQAVFDLENQFENTGNLSLEFDKSVSSICKLTEHPALEEFSLGLTEYRKGGKFPIMTTFSGLFGRSMQYLSFIRRTTFSEISL